MSRFVDATEITTELRIHKQTLRRWVADGLFPKPLRLGRKWVWLRQEYDSHIEAAAKQEQSAD